MRNTWRIILSVTTAVVLGFSFAAAATAGANGAVDVMAVGEAEGGNDPKVPCTFDIVFTGFDAGSVLRQVTVRYQHDPSFDVWRYDETDSLDDLPMVAGSARITVLGGELTLKTGTSHQVDLVAEVVADEVMNKTKTFKIDCVVLIDDPLPGDDDPLPGDDDPLPGDDDPLPGDDDPLPGDDDPAPLSSAGDTSNDDASADTQDSSSDDNSSADAGSRPAEVAGVILTSASRPSADPAPVSRPSADSSATGRRADVLPGTITAPPAAAASPQVDLASTGTDVKGIAFLGASLIGLGASLLIAGRTHRHAVPA